MSGQGVLVVVLGYGCHLTDPVRKYLNSVVKYVKRDHRVSLIITSGGFTARKSAPGVSEAGMMAEYLRSQDLTIPILLEQESRTTKENFLHVRTKTEQEPAFREIVIFCDSCRRFKVFVFALYYLRRWPTIKTYDLTKSWKAKLRQVCMATPLDLLSFVIPALEKRELAIRERRMDSS